MDPLSGLGVWVWLGCADRCSERVRGSDRGGSGQGERGGGETMDIVHKYLMGRGVQSAGARTLHPIKA